MYTLALLAARRNRGTFPPTSSCSSPQTHKPKNTLTLTPSNVGTASSVPSPCLPSADQTHEKWRHILQLHRLYDDYQPHH
ncbi:hypothetical protein COCSADRAFT_38650 [Bipolaris sorokiniana ND90Pr]|uniref:Uncharacterized protein n=1 Tax=Cochliobolus sativus (strain ND90Pr / ATCC 201652) TaxID=665912 RepID=M2S3T1_COCSN|nr:uncharacterized protein COCSADRAFT_38650 [Bipolaris sorokiniana ND90Pr]EMD61848.1 hypothetical protein COCSADRAFT_38650 [Bipolaris sorokiniana ND90Pr]